MAEKFEHYSMEQIASLAASPAGRQLMTMLQQSEGAEMRQAAARAAAGDLEGAKALLAPLLSDPGIQAILARLGGK